MGPNKPREQRRIVLVTCRLRDDGGWSDMTICNLSAYGLMAKCSVPPPRGAFVEVRKGPVTIVGQVRWSRGDRIGIRTRERIDEQSLLGDRSGARSKPDPERRSALRETIATPVKPIPADIAARSRQWSRLFDWMVIAAVAIVSAGVLAGQVYSAIDAPLQQAKVAIAG